MTESLQSINSAMDILSLISNKTPSNKNLNINVKIFQLQNENLRMEGEIKNSNSLKLLENALKSVAIGNNVEKAGSLLKAQTGWLPFAYDLKVNRREDF